MLRQINQKTTLRAALPEALPALWRFALALTRQPHLADDLVQATCLRALERVHQFDPDTRLIAWLLTIARSIWLNERRAETRRATGSLDGAPAGALIDAAPHADTNVFASQVYAEVMQLPEAQRATVELVFVQQFSYADAAAILGIPIGTVMSRLNAARRKLAYLAVDSSGSEPQQRTRP